MNDSERIADFIIRTGYEDLPAEARQVARMCITDTLGTALAASREAIARIIIDYVGTFRGEPTCTIAGSPLRAPAPLAALANGTLAHALDYDDIDWNIIGHPSVAIVPAVLSLGEDLGASGKELITAYLVGLEVEGKLGVCLNPDHYEQGWHSTSTLGTFGAAAASAKLVKLSPEEAQHALGIAASMAGGLIKNFGTMTKPLHAGLAAQQGVMAAQLARRGFTASREIFHGDMNFSQVFSG